MAKVRFSQDFNWNWPGHHGGVSTAYKAGHTYTVKRECADEAVARGVGTEIGGFRATGYETALAKQQAKTMKARKKREADGESTD